MKIETSEHLVELRNSPIHGTGCYAVAPIPARALIVEYTGELIDHATAVARDNPASPDYSEYILEVDEEQYIDALNFEHPAKYVNHSCVPNCILKTVGNRAFIMSVRSIKPGEELAYDYDFDDNDGQMACLCGSDECRGYI